MTGFDHTAWLAHTAQRPGVYRMLDADAAVLYVGKAKNLRKRIASYFSKSHAHPKTRALVKQICDIEITVTRTEAEALLLESNLIKQLRPRYNVLLRDDKSYPYLYLSLDEAFPRLSFYRGAKSGKGSYFGPFPGVKSARHTLNLAQKLFRIRQCDNTFFKNRTRPCLQYQIKRCTAPCVDAISEADYAADIEHCVLFLQGRNEEVIEALTQPMQQASDKQQYERAALYRDQILSLRKVQEKQYINTDSGELDIVACKVQDNHACVQVFYVRGGQNLGNKVFFPRHARGATEEDVINAFITQYYLGDKQYMQIPPQILLSHASEDAELLAGLLTEKQQRKIQIRHVQRGEKRQWISMALENAALALGARLASQERYDTRLDELGQLLQIEEPIERIECFDISHIGGEATVASCVVFTRQGANRQAYRRFNISDVTPGDDYAAIAQAFERRYTRLQREQAVLPELVLIDGGKGQVNTIMDVCNELQLQGINILGVAKGEGRKPGLETLIRSDGRPVRLAADSGVLHLIQEIRDEAHRFAIAGHRRQRGKKRKQSVLEEIAGVGSKRRQELLRFFGGIQGIQQAAMEELAKVPGIDKNLAKKIYDTFHDN
ncbi:MAG: excinuclease ABC subunit UvrC [Gammaproteobacteria bacterium]